jgi:hypothetical protein
LTAQPASAGLLRKGLAVWVVASKGRAPAADRIFKHLTTISVINSFYKWSEVVKQLLKKTPAFSVVKQLPRNRQRFQGNHHPSWSIF